MSKTISTNPKIYARMVLKKQGYSPDFITAVAAYLDAETFIRNGIGRPEYQLLRTQKAISKLGLPESEERLAIDVARNLYQEFISLPPEVQQKPGLIGQRKRNLKIILKKRFERLMGYSDTDIRILNSNARIDFYDYPVYENSDGQTKQKMRARTLTEAEYKTLEELTSRRVFERSDEMSLDISDVDPHELISYSMYNLSRDKVLQRQVTNWDTFQRYVISLLSGEILSRSEMQSNKINPEGALRKAESILRYHRIEKAEREWISLPVDTRIFTRRGVDPQLYEEGLIVRRRMN